MDCFWLSKAVEVVFILLLNKFIPLIRSTALDTWLSCLSFSIAWAGQLTPAKHLLTASSIGLTVKLLHDGQYWGGS